MRVKKQDVSRIVSFPVVSYNNFVPCPSFYSFFCESAVREMYAKHQGFCQAVVERLGHAFLSWKAAESEAPLSLDSD